MSTPTPAFPIDVFGHIVDIIAQRRPRQRELTPASAVYLKDLSLVCKPFTELAQRHLFRCIGYTGRKGAGVLKLILWVVKNAPHIRLYVQDLKLDFNEYKDGDLIDGFEQLTRFPNLQAIELDYKEASSSTPSQPPPDVDLVTPLLHYLIEFYISNGTLRTLVLENLPGVSTSTIVTFMDGRFSRKLLCRGIGMDVMPLLCSPCRITSLAVCDIPSFDLSLLSYLPELISLELAGLSPTLNAEYSMDTLSLNLRELTLILREPGQTNFVIDLYKERAAASGVTAFGRLERLCFGFLDESDILGFNEILRDVPPLRSLSLYAQHYHEPAFPMDTINIDAYFQHPSRPLTSLFIAHHAFPTTEANFSGSLASLQTLLSDIATRNVLETFHYQFSAESDRLSLPPSGPWHDIGGILAPVANFPKLSYVEVALEFVSTRKR